MNSKTMIETVDLSKSFKGRKVIDGLNLLVEEGDIYGFLGPNGAGKTTTIRMLLGLVYPDEGTVKMNGFDIHRDFYHAIEGIGAIVEMPKFHPYLSARSNLMLMANLIGGNAQDRVEEILALVGLKERGKDKVRTYSLGMKQRLGLANALLNEPRLVILDEPTNGLDPQGMKEIRELITRLAAEKGITFFISTHLLHEVEMICNKAAILHQGRIISEGSVKDRRDGEDEEVELVLDQPDKANGILQGLDCVKEVSLTEKGLLVKLTKGQSALLNRYLVQQGLEVFYLTARSQSLETFFIEQTGGEGDGGSDQ